MKFKVDENLPVDVVIALAEAGHDAMSVQDQGLGGHPELDVALACRHEGRAVVTLDVDFADIRTYPLAEYAGVIVLRLRRLGKDHVLRAIQRLLPLLAEDSLSGKLWIVSESVVRIRS